MNVFKGTKGFWMWDYHNFVLTLLKHKVLMPIPLELPGSKNRFSPLYFKESDMESPEHLLLSFYKYSEKISELKFSLILAEFPSLSNVNSASFHCRSTKCDEDHLSAFFLNF